MTLHDLGGSPSWQSSAAAATALFLAIAWLVVASAAQTRQGSDEPRVNSMTVEDTSLWADTDNGFFVFHDNRADTTNDPVPDAWNIYGQPLEFDAVKVYADGGVEVDIDTEDDSNATVSSALDPTVQYVIRLSSGDRSVTVVHEGDIADVKIVPDNADEVREFHDQLVAGSEGTAVVSDALPEPPDEAVNSMTVDDTSLWADTDDGFFVFHDNRADTTNDPVPDPDEPDPVHPPPTDAPDAPSVSLNPTQTELEIKFNASFAVGETKAFTVRIRQRAQPSARTYCRALENTGDDAVHTVITARVFIGSFAQPDTTYLVDYRHVGSGSQDSHWRLSVLGGELMAPSIGRSAALSAITIQSMADLGYSVDEGIADSFTFASVGQPPATFADDPLRPHCVVVPPADIEIVPEPRPNTVRNSTIQFNVSDPIELGKRR